MKDVVRAFPDIVFFQQEKIQSLMANILFNYARENAQVEYKQVNKTLLFAFSCLTSICYFSRECMKF